LTRHFDRSYFMPFTRAIIAQQPHPFTDWASTVSET
jgi:hypothetical protein